MVLVEPLLDPAVEAQALGRVNRIGQSRDTWVHRFVARARPARAAACSAPGTLDAVAEPLLVPLLHTRRSPGYVLRTCPGACSHRPGYRRGATHARR